jgi:hypothetical protein
VPEDLRPVQRLIPGALPFSLPLAVRAPSPDELFSQFHLQFDTVRRLPINGRGTTHSSPSGRSRRLAFRSHASSSCLDFRELKAVLREPLEHDLELEADAPTRPRAQLIAIDVGRD